MHETSIQFAPRNQYKDRNRGSLQGISLHLKSMDLESVLDEFELHHDARLLKTTISICPECGKYSPAAVVASGRKVLMHKTCSTHGKYISTLENDIDFYRLSNKDQWGVAYENNLITDFPEFSSCCGDSGCCEPSPKVTGNVYASQLENKSCTILVEITDACNIKCRVCYARAEGDRIVPIGELKSVIDELCRQKPEIDSIQLTGGEAIMHPGFWEIVDWLYTKKEIGKIYLPTNGIEYIKNDNVQKLKKYRDRLLVLLQFDGVYQETNKQLRNSDSVKLKLNLIKKLDRAGIAMQLTMSLARKVNEQEIAWVVEQGIKNRNVRLIGILPVFYTGRYELDQDPHDRLCLSDVAKGIAKGLDKYVTEDDFMPIPCSHPNCGWTTLFIRRFGLFANIVRFVNPEVAKNKVAYKTVLNEEEMKSVVGTRKDGAFGRIKAWIAKRLIRPKDVFGIAIKPFMDRFTYDQDRVSSCCHHILDTEGKLLSFCEYNTRFRDNDSWKKFPRLDET